MLCQNQVGVSTVKLVLGSTCQINICLNLPRFLACYELRAWELFLIRLANVVARSTKLKHIVNLFACDACLVKNIAVRTRNSDNLATKFCSLLSCTPSHITEARDSNSLALKVETSCSEHLLYEIQSTVTSSLWTYT